MTRVVAALLCTFLLFMQQEAVRHGVVHLRSELAQAHERAITLPDTPCNECALLAAGASALTGIIQPLPLQLAQASLPPSRLVVFRPQATRYYPARAPPSFS